MQLKEGYKRELQLAILDMVKDIDKLCRENNIEYYLGYGSCLGAIRHKGYIPWDDDFDIMMTEDNYYKFLKLCEEKLNSKKYYVQTPEKEEKYYLSFSKIRNIRTTLIEEKNSDIDIVYGIYVDVFPLVGVPNSKIKRFFLQVNRAFMLSANANIINNKYLKTIFTMILKLFGRKRVLKYTTKRCFKYKCSDCNKAVSITDGDGYIEIPKETLGKPVYVPFEDTSLPVPQDYDSYLKLTYGDYMKIPSKEEIKAREHTPYFLDLNLPYADYKNRKRKRKR